MSGALVRPTGGRQPTLFDALALIPLALALLALVAIVAPPRSGPLALAVVLLEQLLVATVVFLPLAAVGRSRRLALAAAIAIGVGALRFGPRWISLPAGGSTDLVVATWNLEIGARTPAQALAELAAVDADVVALEELSSETADALDADPGVRARFPYRVLAGRGDVLGIGLLSRWPLAESSVFDMASWPDEPSRAEAVVHAPGRTIRVIAAHPLPATIGTLGGLPVDFEPAQRDRSLATVRARVDAAIARGERVVLLGDFNTTPAEAAFGDLARGLHDAHAEVGQGPGWTWRPTRLAPLGLGLLRIDLVLSGGGALPVSSAVECTPLGDHCRLRVGLHLT